MVIGIFSYSDELGGGVNHLERTLTLFPAKRFIFMMPKDKLENFRSKITALKEEQMLKTLDNAVALPPIQGYIKSVYGIFKYGSILSSEIKKYGVDFIYFPFTNQYFPLAFQLSRIRWTQLLQLSPGVGSLIFEEGHGYELFRKNVKFIFNYGESKAIKTYLRLLIYQFLAFKRPILTVSESIGYEMKKIGINLNLYTVKPGNGVDTCYDGTDKNIDLIFYARLIPQKGIYDFLKVVKKMTYVNAVIAGFASETVKNEINQYLTKNSLKNRVKLMTNLTSKESAELLKSSKVFVYPTRLDAFPLVVLESLSCGTPVVSYSIPAIRMNYLTDAVIKVKPLDVGSLITETQSILKNEKWVELGKKGKEYASKYKWESVATAEWRILEEIYGAS